MEYLLKYFLTLYLNCFTKLSITKKVQCEHYNIADENIIGATKSKIICGSLSNDIAIFHFTLLLHILLFTSWLHFLYWFYTLIHVYISGSSNYCDSNSCRSFSLLKAIVGTWKSNTYRNRNKAKK